MNNWYNVVITTFDEVTGISCEETIMKINARFLNADELEGLKNKMFEFIKSILAPDLREKAEIKDGKIRIEDCDGGLTVEITITAK